MELRELTTDMQTACHNGDSNSEVFIKIADALYKVKGANILNFNNKTYFVIEADYV